MNNFGVIELASAKTTAAPGWAYVPDTGAARGSALQPSNRKRARNAPGGGMSIGDLTARQEARIRKEVEALDRDAAKDNTIPVPTKSGRVASGKSTLTVRKILQSQKTFANHLDDFLAFQAQADNNAPGVTNNATNSRPSISQASTSKRPALGRKDRKDSAAHSTKTSTPAPDEDVVMGDDAAAATTTTSTTTADPSAPTVLPPPYSAPPPPHPGDDDPLLASRVPEMPPEAELRVLLAHPPLSYLEARGAWEDGVAAAYPRRVFCEVCGYWGRVRCMKCGTRVCALDCLDTHREECVTRYGL